MSIKNAVDNVGLEPGAKFRRKPEPLRGATACNDVEDRLLFECIIWGWESGAKPQQPGQGMQQRVMMMMMMLQNSLQEVGSLGAAAALAFGRPRPGGAGPGGQHASAFR